MNLCRHLTPTHTTHHPHTTHHLHTTHLIQGIESIRERKSKCFSVHCASNLLRLTTALWGFFQRWEPFYPLMANAITCACGWTVRSKIIVAAQLRKQIHSRNGEREKQSYGRRYCMDWTGLLICWFFFLIFLWWSFASLVKLPHVEATQDLQFPGEFYSPAPRSPHKPTHTHNTHCEPLKKVDMTTRCFQDLFDPNPYFTALSH